MPANGGKEVKGDITIPNLSEENDLEDIDVRNLLIVQSLYFPSTYLLKLVLQLMQSDSNLLYIPNNMPSGIVLIGVD